MTSPLARRLLALPLAITLCLCTSFVSVSAADQGLLSGRVMETDGVTPRSGVVVALVDAASHDIYRSAPTTAEGAFLIDSAPAGGYRLLAETPDGAFLASDDFKLGAGANQAVALKLAPQATDPNVTMAPGQAGSGASWWQWLIAGSIVVAGLLVVADASNETNASPN